MAAAVWLAALCASSVLARHVDLTIVHTTDLHGHIWPTVDYGGRTNVGGFLRCAARIEAIRQETPNLLLIDCGDTFQGSPESYLTGGRLVIEGLNTLGYDAWVLGNHEFDWGVNALRRLHDLAEIPILAANLYFQSPEASWLPELQPYVIREVEGIRVAIIGLSTPGIPRWSRPHLLQGAMFRRSLETLAGILPLVKAERPDVLVVAVHQGFKQRGDDFANEIQSIAQTFPEIDVLIGGHSHAAVDDMRINGVLYTQAGYHGIWLGCVELTYDTVGKRVISKRARLEIMDETVPFHEGLLAGWGKELDRAERKLGEVIGYLPHRLDPEPDARGRSSMQQLIAESIARGTGAELALHGSLGDHRLGPGPLTYRDIWKIVPYENTVGVVALTPGEIREILEENHGRPLTTHSLGPWGFTYQMVEGNMMPHISDLRDENGDPLHARRRYRVALNSYVLASGGNRYSRTRTLAERPSSRLTMLEADTRSLVAEHIRARFPVPSPTGTRMPSGAFPPPGQAVAP